MEMHTTIICKNVLCPKWGIRVPLSGKYSFSDTPGEEYIAHFMFSTCPIVENSCLPLHKQAKEYKLMLCPEYRSCELLNNFPTQIDVRKGYSL